MTNNANSVNETLKTTFDLGYVFANTEEGEKEGVIVEAGFKKEVRESKKTAQMKEFDVCVVKVEFRNEDKNSTYLFYKTIVSRAESSRFINLLKQFSVSFSEGKVDVSKMIGATVIADIKNNQDNSGNWYSNIESLLKRT